MSFELIAISLLSLAVIIGVAYVVIRYAVKHGNRDKAHRNS